MSDTSTDFAFTPEQEAALPAGFRDSLKETQRRLTEANQKASEAERSNAFLRAGIPDGALGELFRKSYEGELVPDGIRAGYDALLQSVGATGQQGNANGAGETSSQDLSGHQRINEAGAGESAPSTPGRASHMAEMAKCQTIEELQAYIGTHSSELVDDSGTAVGRKLANKD